MRRKANSLLSLEAEILDTTLKLRQSGIEESHGFLLAKEMKQRTDGRLLTSYGTLYKALARLEKAGLLASQWEQPTIAEQEHRPRRRLYSLTADGVKALNVFRAFERPGVRLMPVMASG